MGRGLAEVWVDVEVGMSEEVPAMVVVGKDCVEEEVGVERVEEEV